MDSFIRFVGIIAGSGLLTWFTFEPIGRMYINLFKPSGSFLGEGVAILTGLPTMFLFFSFLGTAFLFSKKDKYIYFILGGLILLLYGFMDPLHIYFPFIFGFIGLGLGLLARKGYTKYLAK